MKYQQTITDLEDEWMAHNQASVEELFELYSDLHFIYPHKLDRLQPVLNTVKLHWGKAMKMNFPLFWVSTLNPNSSHINATSTAWQYLNKGMIGQHLTANHPVGSRIILMGMLKKIIENQHNGFLESFQIYYRPENKYPSRVFETVSAKAGHSLSQVIPYHYFEMPFVQAPADEYMDLVEIDDGYQPDFIHFMKTQRGDFFINAQELNAKDIGLKALDSRFVAHGLTRTRRVFAVIGVADQRMYGAVIINQSSLGLNFSFFENSCELILCKGAEPKQILSAAAQLLGKASSIASGLPLNYFPVMIDPVHSHLLEAHHGKHTRNYNLFMILKGGYETWYDYIDQLTNNIYKRFINTTNANTITP